MIGDVIETFRNTTPVADQKFLTKSHIETSTLITQFQNLICPCLLSYAIFLPNVQKVFTANTKMNKDLPKKPYDS